MPLSPPKKKKKAKTHDPKLNNFSGFAKALKEPTVLKV